MKVKDAIKMPEKTCGNCKHIYPKENHPHTKGHICCLYSDILLHGNYHPDLVKCSTCYEHELKKIGDRELKIVWDEEKLREKMINFCDYYMTHGIYPTKLEIKRAIKESGCVEIKESRRG